MEQEKGLKKWDNDREEKKEELSKMCLHTQKETRNSKKHNETEVQRKVEITDINHSYKLTWTSSTPQLLRSYKKLKWWN